VSGMVGLGGLAPATDAAGFPRPSPVPLRWQLEFQPGALRIYVDPHDATPYWYFTYKVSNFTGQDQLWVPRITLFTDAGTIQQAGEGVPSRVTESILALLRAPFLEDQNEIIGDLFQGREHAREGLSIWPANDIDVNELSIFVAGISGETAKVANPVSGDEQILQKTLQINYHIAGDVLPRGSTPVEVVSTEWILR
jgi:hypothetical protein